LLFRLPLRQTEGFLYSILTLMGSLNLSQFVVGIKV
jgi:hypothetical protein